jgi:integrase
MAHQHSEHHASAGASRALSENAIVRTSRLKLNAQGYWLVSYSVPGENGVGWRSKTFSTKTKDHQAAQEALEDWLRSAREDQAETAREKQLTVGDLLELYAQKKAFRPTEQASYTIKTLRTHLGGLVPADVTDRVVQEYKRLRTHPRTGKAVSTSTLRRELGTLVAALNHGARHKYVAATDVPVIELPAETAARVRFMDHAQEAAFWQAAQDAGGAVGLFVALGLDTAARKGAILGLTWDRVDLTRRLIDFQDPTRAPNRKRRVVVPISTRLLPVLERAAHGVHPNARLFDTGLRKAYEAFARRLGLDWVTAHVLRHTWASLAAQDGVPLFHIAKMLGDTVATVERTYAHLQPAHLHDVVNRRWISTAVPAAASSGHSLEARGVQTPGLVHSEDAA